MNRSLELSTFSADVRLTMVCKGQVMSLSQVAPDWVIPCEPLDMPPGTEVDVVVSVDGEVSRRRVVLVDGMKPGGRVRVPVKALGGTGVAEV